MRVVKSRRMRWAGHVARMGERGGVYRVLVWKPEGKRTIGRPRHRPNIVRVIKSRRMIWAGHVARMWERRGVYRVLVWKPGGKRPLGRPRHRWENNIKVDLQEVGCGDMD